MEIEFIGFVTREPTESAKVYEETKSPTDTKTQSKTDVNRDLEEMIDKIGTFFPEEHR